MVFLIDLPRLGEGQAHEPTSFSLELQYFLRAMGVEGKMVDSLCGYDFSKTAGQSWVRPHQVRCPTERHGPHQSSSRDPRPGGHTDESLKRVGLWQPSRTCTTPADSRPRVLWIGSNRGCAGASIYRAHRGRRGGMCSQHPRRGQRANVGNQCASLGSIKCDLLEAMYNACQGV